MKNMSEKVPQRKEKERVGVHPVRGVCMRTPTNRKGKGSRQENVQNAGTQAAAEWRCEAQI